MKGATVGTTDELIDRLVADATPVRRLIDPSRRATIWVAIALVCLGVGLFSFGARRDLAAVSHHLTFWLRLALLTATMWLAVTSSFRLAVPGGEPRSWRRWWPLAALGVLVAVAAVEVTAGALGGDLGSPFRAWMCARKVLLVGALPALLAVVLINRAVPMEPQWSVLLGILAAGAAGGLASELTCPVESPLHMLLWHVMPVALSLGVGALIGTAVSGWRRAGLGGSKDPPDTPRTASAGRRPGATAPRRRRRARGSLAPARRDR